MKVKQLGASGSGQVGDGGHGGEVDWDAGWH